MRDGIRLRQGGAPSALQADAELPGSSGGQAGPGVSTAHAVEASNLQFRYGNLPVVADLDLKIPKGGSM